MVFSARTTRQSLLSALSSPCCLITQRVCSSFPTTDLSPSVGFGGCQDRCCCRPPGFLYPEGRGVLGWAGSFCLGGPRWSDVQIKAFCLMCLSLLHRLPGSWRHEETEGFAFHVQCPIEFIKFCVSGEAANSSSGTLPLSNFKCKFGLWAKAPRRKISQDCLSLFPFSEKHEFLCKINFG